MNRAKFIKIPSYYPVPDGKGHWVSDAPLIFYSKKLNLEFYIPAGAVNDLASIPRFARNLVPVNGPHRIAAALHDFVYEVNGYMNERVLTRKEADSLFLEAMLTLKMDYVDAIPITVKRNLQANGLLQCFLNSEPLVTPFIANTMYKAVRVGGKGYWES